jgi:small subunit ribosomal protein S7
MPRRGHVPKRKVLPDPVYQSPLVTKFINCMMLDGKRSVTESIFYSAMESIKERTNEDPLKVFRSAVDNVKPALEVKSRRVGGSNYQVPVEVRPQRRMALALRWLISFARARPEKSMNEKLANEIVDAANGRGNTFKKKEDTHRMAEANKAFAHFRW